MASIARELAAADSVDEVLHRTVVLGQRYLDGCDGVSVMLIRKGGRATVPAASSDLAHDAAVAQFAADEGPCFSAIADHEPMASHDLREERRWPAYRVRALELGVRSLLDVRLFAREDTMGALGCYSTAPGTFDGDAAIYAQVFASHAAVALKAAISESGLASALRSRDVNGQAKGVIMEREGVTAEGALERLRQLSQDRQQPLRDLADEIVRTGTIPAPARDA